jgi:hypothetical protein
LAAGRAREPRLSRLARQRLPVLSRRPAEPVELGNPDLHADHDLEFARASDQVAVRRGLAKRGLDLSLWQTAAIGLRALIDCDWTLRRANAVAVVTGVTW